MKKKAYTTVLTIISLLFVLGCSSTTEDENTRDELSSTKNSAEMKAVTITVSLLGPPDYVGSKAMYTFEEELERLSNGQINVEVHHSGSLYGQGADERAVVRGNLGMAIIDANAVANYLPEASMFNASYMFKNYEHMNSVMNGEIGKTYFDKVAKEVGYRPLAAFYAGERQLNYRDIGREIRTPEDVKGMMLRMPDNPAMVFIGEAMGASVTPLAFGEVYTALSTGTIDAQDNALEIMISNKFHEVTDYVSLTNHVVDNVWPIINEELFQELGPELQEMVYVAINKARDEMAKSTIKVKEESIEFLRNEGLTVIEDVDIDAFSTQVQEMYLNSDISEAWDMNLYKEIQDMADKH